jgi:prophage regulatory protein
VKLLSFHELRPQKGIRYCRDHLRRKIAAGEFPKPIRVSDNHIAWLEEEIDRYIEQLVAKRDGLPVPEPIEAGGVRRSV